jgi:hypothetical protein
MRIKQSTSFPHPVLASHTGDYGDRNFSITLAIEEAPEAGAVFLLGTALVDDQPTQQLINSGKAKFGLMIHCQDTYLDQFIEFPVGEIRLDLTGGRVRGTIYVRGVIISAQDNLSLESKHIVKEFPAEARFVETGDFIALTEELSFEAGLEKLAPLESIFRLKKSEEIPEGQFQLGLDSEAIEILAHPTLYDVLYNFREQAVMRDLLLPSLYLPVIMSVLDAMRESDFTDKRWHSVMSARCKSEGIDVTTDLDLAVAAQKLLDAPISLLKTVAERIS